MAFTLSAVITAYDALGTLVTATATARTNLAAIGARPTMPVDVTATADQTTVTTNQATWDTNNASLSTLVQTAVTAQIAGELAVTSLILPKQWYKMTLLTNWADATQYIGIRPTNAPITVNAPLPNTIGIMFTILATTTNPTVAFPNVS